MAIPVQPQPPDLFDDLELCIFCTVETNLWYIAKNRPVCRVCACIYKESDIDNAHYNY